MKAKRILLLATAAFALLSLSSCGKEYYIEDDGVQMKHIDYTVLNTDWDVQELDNGARLLSVTLNVPQITKDVVNYGSVSVSRRLFDDNGNIFWTPLPAVRAEYENYGTSEELLYSTYLDYEWTTGLVYVYFTATDFYVDPDKANWPDMDLRVTIFQYE
jgi:hypothetical protein